MNNEPTPDGVIILSSPYAVKDTIDRLQDLLKQVGATIYARIDQQRELERVGQKMAPIEFLMFGNPKAGGPVMQENPLAALDLPLKVIAWQDEQQKVWIGYNKATYIRDRYALSPSISAPLSIDGLIKKLIS